MDGRQVVDEVWSTGQVPDRSGMAAYIILIRSPEDPPEEQFRTRGRGQDGGGADGTYRSAGIRKGDRTQARELLLGLLGEHGPCTFNTLSLYGWGRAADAVGGVGTAVEEALWDLVAEGTVEHTMASPIRFRLREATV